MNSMELVMLEENFVEFFKNKVVNKELFDSEFDVWEEWFFDNDLCFDNEFSYFVRCVYVGDGELERFEEEFEFLCDDDNSENEKIEYVRNWFSDVELNDDEVSYIINVINSMNEWYNGY